MSNKLITTLVFCMIVLPPFVMSQQIVQPFPDGGPYDPAKEHDIDDYLRGWRGAPMSQVHGTVEAYDMFTPGDSLNPDRPGAVLNYIDSYAYCRLLPRAETPDVTLDGTQEILYIAAGMGTITTGGKTIALRKAVAVFIPDGVTFHIANSGPDRLEFYRVVESTPPGFTPASDILVKDANTLPFASIGGHWWHKVKTLFSTADGLAQVETVLQVTFDPLTIGHPHIYPAGQLEIWCQVEGTTTAWIGKQVRVQEPGMAYMVPPDGKVSHSNINATDREAVFFYTFSTPK